MADRGSLHEAGSRRPTGIRRPASAAENRSRPLAGRLPCAQKLRLRRDPGGQFFGYESELLVGSNRPGAVGSAKKTPSISARSRRC